MNRICAICDFDCGNEHHPFDYFEEKVNTNINHIRLLLSNNENKFNDNEPCNLFWKDVKHLVIDFGKECYIEGSLLNYDGSNKQTCINSSEVLFNGILESLSK